MRKKLIGVCLILAMVGGVFTNSFIANAKCSSWTEYAKGETYCNPAKGCGFLGKYSTRMYSSLQTRYCSKNNKQVKENRIVAIKTGCCE